MLVKLVCGKVLHLNGQPANYLANINTLGDEVAPSGDQIQYYAVIFNPTRAQFFLCFLMLYRNENADFENKFLRVYVAIHIFRTGICNFNFTCCITDFKFITVNLQKISVLYASWQIIYYPKFSLYEDGMFNIIKHSLCIFPATSTRALVFVCTQT
jgi:hypothetical protein